MMELLLTGGLHAQTGSSRQCRQQGLAGLAEQSSNRRYVSPALAVFLVVYLAFCCLALNCISFLTWRLCLCLA